MSKIVSTDYIVPTRGSPTIIGPIAEPVVPSHPATKRYVDEMIADVVVQQGGYVSDGITTTFTGAATIAARIDWLKVGNVVTVNVSTGSGIAGTNAGMTASVQLPLGMRPTVYAAFRPCLIGSNYSGMGILVVDTFGTITYRPLASTQFTQGDVVMCTGAIVFCTEAPGF